MNVLCILNHDRVEIQNMAVALTSDNIQIKMNMSNIQKVLASSKAQNYKLKDMDVLCSFKIKIESQNLASNCGLRYAWKFGPKYCQKNPIILPVV